MALDSYLSLWSVIFEYQGKGDIRIKKSALMYFAKRIQKIKLRVRVRLELVGPYLSIKTYLRLYFNSF